MSDPYAGIGATADPYAGIGAASGGSDPVLPGQRADPKALRALANTPSGAAVSRATAAQTVIDNGINALSGVAKYFPTAPGAAVINLIGATGSKPSEVARSSQQGATYGLADELRSGAYAAGTGIRNLITGENQSVPEAYTASMQAEKAARQDYARRKPVSNALATLAGGVIAPGGAEGAEFIGAAPSLVGSVGRSSLVGGAMGAAAGAGSSDGGVGERAIGAAKGAVTGAVTGAALPVVARGAQAAANTLAAVTKGGARAVNALAGGTMIDPAAGAISRLTDAMRTDGMATADIAKALDTWKQTGASDPALLDLVGENTRALLRTAASKPGAARNAAVNYAGKVTSDLQDNMIGRTGALTPGDARSATTASGDIQGATDAAVNSVPDMIAGRAGMEAGTGGAATSRALNQRFDQAKAGVDAAYDAARAADPGRAHLPIAERPKIAANIREAVSNFDPLDVPRVTRQLGMLDNTGTLTVRDLFDLRSRLSSLRASGDPVEGSAASAAVRALDGQIDAAATGNLIGGDPAVVDLWKRAIQARRQFGQQFESNDLIAQLTNRTTRGGARALSVAPEDATNAIFGRSATGMAGRPNLARDLTRLRDTLGADSPEWNALRGEAVQRVMGQDGETGDFGSSFQALEARDPTLARLLITPAERAQLVTARSTVAAGQQLSGGLDTGQSILASTADPDGFAAQISAMNPDARQSAQVGARQAIQDALGNRKAGSLELLQRIASGTNMRRNLEVLFGADEAGRYIDAASNELSKVGNARFISPNTGSQTQLRQADQGLPDIPTSKAGAIAWVINKFRNGATLTPQERQVLVELGIASPEVALRTLRRVPTKAPLRVDSSGAVPALTNALGGATGQRGQTGN